MEIVMSDQELLEVCRTRLDYNPETGIFLWKLPYTYHRLNKEAGNVYSTGYKRIRIEGKRYPAHRLAFLMYYGYLPKSIDHINRIKTDNRIINLRESTSSENSKNIGAQSNNTTGYKGVAAPSKGRNRYRVRIMSEGRDINIGSFKCKHEAARAYNLAARMYHGKFAYTNTVPNE